MSLIKSMGGWQARIEYNIKWRNLHSCVCASVYYANYQLSTHEIAGMASGTRRDSSCTILHLLRCYLWWFPRFQSREDYWNTFYLQEEDVEFLYNYLLEKEIPLTSREMTEALVKEAVSN